MKCKLSIVIPSIILMSATCNKTDKSVHHLLVESSFDDDKPFRAWNNRQHCCDYSITKSNTRFTDGSYSLRFEIRSTDPHTSGSVRSELTQDSDEPGTERWYGFSMYLENWEYDDAGEHVFQWHPDNSSGTATASLWASSGRYVFQTNSTGGNAAASSRYNDLGPILNNQWVSWVIHVKWATDKSGILQVWKNGSLMIDQSNIETCPSEGTYFKLGINKFGWGIQATTTNQRVLYFDEVRIGNESATYDDVKPRKS